MAVSHDPMILLIPLVVLLALLSAAAADVKTYTFESDPRPLTLLQNFGFSSSGRVVLSISCLSVSSSSKAFHRSSLGFFLMSEEALSGLLLAAKHDPNFCVLHHTRYITPVLTFRNPSSLQGSSFNRSHSVASPNMYGLYFANCGPYSRVSMRVRTDLYNMDEDGSINYLSIGKTQLPALNLVFSVAYSAFLGVWILNCFRNRRAFDVMHLTMALLLVLKVFTMICTTQFHDHVRQTGTPDGWAVILLWLHIWCTVIYFTVLAMIVKGSSFLRPFRSKKAKKVLIAAISLQVLNNITFFVIRELAGITGNEGKTENVAVLYCISFVIEVACCSTVVFQIVWTTRLLKKISADDEKAALDLAKANAFRKFYYGIMGYFFVCGIVLFALKVAMGYEYEWVNSAAQEIVEIVFYAVMFYLFRPAMKDDYVVLDDGDVSEEAGNDVAALKEDEVVADGVVANV